MRIIDGKLAISVDNLPKQYNFGVGDAVTMSQVFPKTLPVNHLGISSEYFKSSNQRN